MSYVSIPSAAGGVSDIRSYWLNKAADRLSVDPDDLLFDFHLFAARGINGLSETITTTGTKLYIAKALTITTGGAGGQYTAEMGTVTAGPQRPGFIPDGAAEKWWIAGNWAHGTFTGANTRAGVGALTGAGTLTIELLMGAHGTVHASNFVFFGRTGANINSGVAIDLVFRTHEGWRDGSTSHYAIDEGATFQGSADVRPNAGQDCGLAAHIQDSGASRDINLVWMAAAVIKP